MQLRVASSNIPRKSRRYPFSSGAPVSTKIYGAVSIDKAVRETNLGAGKTFSGPNIPVSSDTSHSVDVKTVKINPESWQDKHC